MMRRRASRCQSGRSFDQSRIVSRTVFCGAAGFCISCSSVALQDDGKAPLGVRIELLGGALQELVTANLGRSGFAHNHARSEEHTSELQSLMRISYAVFCLKKKTNNKNQQHIIKTS